ncbi:DEKNAAC100886 [Brettanomyces naardenensis]|uniref:allantoicase n=1 Tax=Brettanomyces naardenensis TaxID=13370 RepID=A0A448YEG7_BRENA|nr:DEKNAAC100886 [Brettanomyces naardenensis]
MTNATKVEESYFQEKIVSRYTDVISSKLGGEIVSVSNEWFAKAENLIKPGKPIREAARFTFAGAWYDGWETRRHNPEIADWVIFKMGVASARLIGCEVDTAYFNGNQAPYISVEASTSGDIDANWEEIIPKVACGPSQRHFFIRNEGLTDTAYTHARLRMYPDGGIARFRLFGKVVPIATLDASAVINSASCLQGGVCVSASDQHFSPASNILLPGRGHDMSDGWETTRSREEGHVDWAIVKLGFRTRVSKITVDTAFFRGNYPESITVEGIDTKEESPASDDKGWKFIVERSKTTADAEHDYAIEGGEFYTHVKLTMIPDGGVKRLNVWGTAV